MTESRNERVDTYAKLLRDNASMVDKTAFIDSGKRVILVERNNANAAEKAAKRLWRFVTDYSWWSGQKTVDRGDFYL